MTKRTPRHRRARYAARLLPERGHRHDSLMLAPTLDAIPAPAQRSARTPAPTPRQAARRQAYDAKPRRQECRARGIVPRIARKGVDSSERLGRHRWVVERTHAWFNRFGACPSDTKDVADIYEAFTSLTALLITLNQINRFC